MFTLERNMLTTSKKSSKEPVSCNLPSFNSLLRARRETSIKCAQDALEVEEMETDDTPQMKKRKIKSSHEALVNPVISIPFPECGDWPERQVNVLWGVKSSDLWVELTPANMKHLKCILKTEMEKGEVTCKKKGSPKKKRGSPKKSPRRRLRRSNPLAESPMADGEQVEETLVDSDHAEMVAETLEYVEGCHTFHFPQLEVERSIPLCCSTSLDLFQEHGFHPASFDWHLSRYASRGTTLL